MDHRPFLLTDKLAQKCFSYKWKNQLGSHENSLTFSFIFRKLQYESVIKINITYCRNILPYRISGLQNVSRTSKIGMFSHWSAAALHAFVKSIYTMVTLKIANITDAKLVIILLCTPTWAGHDILSIVIVIQFCRIYGSLLSIFFSSLSLRQNFLSLISFSYDFVF